MALAKKDSFFGRIARKMAHASGTPYAFLSAVSLVLIWAFSGPMFGYSETWQLVINTSTTIVTFLMVFIIQHTQNKDTTALQLKLDELLRNTDGAHNALMDLEELSDEELERIHKKYLHLARISREKIRNGQEDTKNKMQIDLT